MGEPEGDDSFLDDEGHLSDGSTDAEAPDEDDSRWSWPRRILTTLLVLVVVLGVAGVGGFLYLQHRLGGQVDRIPGVFAGLENRPTRVTTGDTEKALNVLLIGTDRRSEVATTGDNAESPEWEPGAQRSDTMMILHIDADRRGASVISIPRDSWVEIPGHGRDKINAAFSLGGPALAVETVERLTDVRIDHLAVVDWAGFAALTDALGGVTVTIPETVHDSARDYTWTAGEHHLDGEQALLYARQRYGLPGGDLDRVQRQQAFLRSLATSTLNRAGSKNPAAIYELLDVLTKNLSVDEEWSTGQMRDLLFSLRSLRGGSIDYLTAPVSGFGTEGAASVVYLDDDLGRGLWKSVREDDVESWVEAHPGELTPQVVR